MISENSIINLNTISDHRGSLISLEQQHQVPFDIQRVYYLYNLNSEARGFHAHKQLKQMMICLSGSCTLMLDNGASKQYLELTSPSQAVLIDTLVWHEMFNFSQNCILLILASDVYKESDYIRDYTEFLKATTSK